MFFIFLMASSQRKPVTSSIAAATTKSNRVQCTSSVKRIAIKGIHNSSAVVSTMIKTLFFCKINLFLPLRQPALLQSFFPYIKNDLSLLIFKSNFGAKPYLNFKRATESSGCIIRLCAIVIYEHMAIPVIGKDRATMFPDF